MKNIIVLGAGMVGSAMAIDMAKKHNVTLTDINIHTLEKTKRKCSSISFLLLDATDKDRLRSTINNFDLVICAVPGFLGF